MKKNYLPFVAGIVIVVLIFSVVLSSFRSTQKNKLPQTSILTLETDKSIFKPGEQFTITLSLDSKDQEVAAADFVLKFDPAIVKVIDSTTGNYFTDYPINTKGNDFVKISGVASFDGESLVIPKGRDTVASVTFQGLRTGISDIYFDENKTIIATNGQNILDKKKLSKLEITISD